MKVCITSTGPNLEAEMDPRFGRCQYFIFANPETMKFEAVENPNLGAAGGAGIQSAQLVINRGVEALITGQVGPNAFTTLQAGGIKIITGVTGQIKEVLEKYKKGELTSLAQGPTVRAHYGMGVGRGGGRAVPPPTPKPPGPESPSEELKELREQSRQLKEQLDKITARLEKLEAKK
ncbi:MAG: NifB/NifX family molybdenum-iron cluster-binding protein [bacterium]